ncbi:hypothetical protein POVWA2_060140 [Plasmodium ovale wallikeri]|uniref:Growth arrest-specific protein 8 domain-containing protein n=1 Tax=Plasmodium ovale wallikeri TaxID=864142 RepID=A0A1A9A2V2_PLAOA|nr:hypothetical protein POVWA2_060140 [Plasmodium ovale wallikeri]
MMRMEELFTKHLKVYEDDQKEDMEEMIENYEIMERNEIIYLKNLYNDHINKVNEIYIDVLQNYKKYYIDQIRENIAKIKSLKKNINELELNDKEIKNDLNNYNSQNSSMQENIKNLEMKRYCTNKHRKRVLHMFEAGMQLAKEENLNKDLKFYSKDFVIFKNLELIYNESEVYIKNLQQFAQSSKDKILQVENALKKLSQDEDINFDGYFENIKNKNIILRKKIEGLNFDLDAVKKELASYIKKNNIKEEDVQRVRKGINFCLHTYNKEYDNLLYAQRNVKKKIKNSVNIYEKKLKDINVRKGP